MKSLEAKKDGNGNIIITEDSFEFLLSCLDSQKFNPAANEQKIIDDYNTECRNILHQRYVFETTDDGIYLYKKYLYQDTDVPWSSDDRYKISELFKDTRMNVDESILPNDNDVEIHYMPWLIERPMRYDDIYLAISEDGINYRAWKDDEIENIRKLLFGVEKHEEIKYVETVWSKQLSKMNINFIENFLRKYKIKKMS